MIPKILHQIWIGDRLLSPEHSRFMGEWQKIYSDFRYECWTDLRVKEEGIIPQSKLLYYNGDFPVALKADLLRYEIIRKYGGIYADVDMEPLRRLEDGVLDCRFIGGIQNNGEVAIGFFGAEPECPLIVDVCESVVAHIERLLSKNVNRVHVDQYTGPMFFDSKCSVYRTNREYVFFQPQYFYPYWFTETHRRYEDFRTTSPESYAVHHWSKNWI